MVEKIIMDETWLEGERRGCPVPPLDAVVNENVCRIVLEVGEELRQSAIRRLQKTRGAPTRWIERVRIALSAWRRPGPRNGGDSRASHE